MEHKTFLDRVFPKSEFLNEPPYKKHKLIVDILITIALFAIAETIISFIITPFQLVQVFQNLDLSSGEIDIEQILAAVNNMPPWVNVITLFSFIFITLTVIVCRVKIQKGTLYSLGFTKKNLCRDYIIGLLIGCGIFSLAVGLAVLMNGLTFNGLVNQDSTNLVYIILFFLGFVVQGMAEEILCRGFLMTAITRRHSVWLAVLINSLFFACLHIFNNGISILAFFNLTLFGIFASLIMLKSGNIWMVAAIHTMWNFVQGNFYGISVSGMAESPTIFKFIPTELSFINGGAFGMEGGICITIMLIIGIVIAALIPLKNKTIPD